MARTRVVTVMNISVYATVLAGLGLYGIVSNWLQSAWVKSSSGIGFTFGALFGLVGFFTGLMNGSNNRKMAALGSQMLGKPTPEQAAQLGAIQKQQSWVVPISSWSLLLAAFFMATARYFVF